MSYSVVDAKWGTPTNGQSSGIISYSTDILNGLNYDASLYSAEDFELALVAALETWEMVAAVDFELAVNPADADLTFDMIALSGSTVGRATYSYYLLNGTDRIFDADVVFDSTETWAPFGETDLSFYAVALHEVGHILGLDHVEDTSEIMNPYVASNTLGDGDVAGIRFIYGADPGDVLIPPGPEYWSGESEPDGGGTPPLPEPEPEPVPEPEPEPILSWGGTRWRDRFNPPETEEPAPAPEPSGEEPAPEPEPEPEPEPLFTWGGTRWRDRFNLQETRDGDVSASSDVSEMATDSPAVSFWFEAASDRMILRLEQLRDGGDFFDFTNLIETHSHDFYVLEDGQSPEDFYASLGHHHDHDHDTGCGHGGGCDCGRDQDDEDSPLAEFGAADCFHWADDVLVS